MNEPESTTEVISYVRLVSGDEIIGPVEEHDGILRITNPLLIEIKLDPSDLSRRYVYMTRCVPYAEAPQIDLKPQMVVFHVPVSPAVVDYYHSSLEYCRKITDVNFEMGISETTELLRQNVVSEEEESIALLASAFMGCGSNTVN